MRMLGILAPAFGQPNRCTLGREYRVPFCADAIGQLLTSAGVVTMLVREFS
jgi:hypothetical protein